MLISSLRLRNFCGFSDLELDFNRGLNILCGPNGSGKSTILEALNILYYASKIRNFDSYIKFGSSIAELESTFLYNGLLYTITKKISCNYGQKAELRDFSNKVLASTVSGVQEIINSIISDVEVDLQAWYLRQGAITSFADCISSNSASFIETLLGIGNVGNIKRTFIDSLKIRYPSRELELADYDKLIAEFENKKQELNNELASFSTIQEEYLSLKFIKDSLEEKLVLARRKRKLDSLQDRLLENKHKLSETNARLIQLKQAVEEDNKRLAEVVYTAFSRLGMTPSGKPSYDSSVLFNQLQETKVKYKLYHDKRTLLERVKEELFRLFRQRPAPVKTIYSTLERQVSYLHSKLEESKKHLKLLDSEDLEYCPLCKQELNKASIAAIRAEVVSLERELDAVVTKFNKVLVQYRTYKDIVSKCKDKLLLCKGYRNDMKNLYTTIDLSVCEEFLSLIGGINISLNNNKTQANILERTKQSLENEIASLEAQISELSSIFLDSSLEELEASYNSVSERWNEINVKYHLLLKFKKDLEELDKRIDDLTSSRTKILQQEELHKYCKNFINIVSDAIPQLVRKYISVKLLPSINSFLTLVEAPFRIIFKSSGDQLLLLAGFDDNIVLDFGSLSYGQRVILSLISAFIFYINNNSSGVLLIDEPTAGLDARNIQGLATILEHIDTNCLEKGVQCIIASHEYDQLRPFSYNVITLEKEANT